MMCDPNTYGLFPTPKLLAMEGSQERNGEVLNGSMETESTPIKKLLGKETDLNDSMETPSTPKRKSTGKEKETITLPPGLATAVSADQL